VVRAGLYYGRTGTALGTGVSLEVNPIRWFGLCAFGSQSRATTVNENDPVKEWDAVFGACATTHLPQMKGFLISPFFQWAYQSDHQRVDIPLSDGTIYQETHGEIHHLWTVGSAVDRAIVTNGPRWMVRVGRNIGSGPAAQHAGGLYAVGGIVFPLDHPVELARSFRRMVGWKP